MGAKNQGPTPEQLEASLAKVRAGRNPDRTFPPHATDSAYVRKITRETLEDRYEGLVYDPETEAPRDEWTELQRRLSFSLTDFAAGTARCHGDDAGPIVDELHVMIREHIVKRVDELGLAR